MKLTKSQLKEIIKEEIGRTISEADPLVGPTRAPGVQAAPATDPDDPMSGPTRAPPAEAVPTDNRQLALVAKELQVLLAKIKKVLGA